MEKRYMRIISMLMALVMTLGLCLTSFADSDYSITVENSIGGKSYDAYKIFDAQYNGDAVSYTIDSDSAWYPVVLAADDVFKLTRYSVTGEGPEAVTTYHVEVMDGVSDEAVIDVFNKAVTVTYDDYGNATAAVGGMILSASASGRGDGGALTLELEKPGYYYVTTSSGSVISITTAAPDGIIVDKNQTPGGGEFDKTANGVHDGSYAVGDTINYVITAYVPTYDGTEKILSYTFTDSMGAGLTYNKDISVVITGTFPESFERSGLDITDICDMGLKWNGTANVLTITYEIFDDEGNLKIENYPADASVEITYTCLVNDKADERNLGNDVDLNWYRADGPDHDQPDPDRPKTDGSTFGFDLQKTDSSQTPERLDGAQFTIQKQTGVDAQEQPEYGEPIEFFNDQYSWKNDVYGKWDGVTEAASITTIINVKDGLVGVWGLGEGTYKLTEIVAPDGYNLLAEPVIIEIRRTDEGWDVIFNGETSSGVFAKGGHDHGVYTMPTVTVQNAAGSTLPSTGGMGTTILYVIGVLLVLAAAALLIARWRLGRSE